MREMRAAMPGARLFLFINLLALLAFLVGLSWAIAGPEANRLVVVDIGIIAAVGLWFAGQILRILSSSGKSL